MTDCLVIKISELADKLGLSKSTVKRWVDRGLLPEPVTHSELFKSKGGGTEEMFWFKDDIDAWLDKLRNVQIRLQQQQQNEPLTGYMGYSTGKISFDIGKSLNRVVIPGMEELPDLTGSEFRDIKDWLRNLNNE